MVQSPSWEGNWFAASQEIPHILRKPKVYYRTQNVRYLSLSWASPIQSTYPHPTSWRSILILIIYLRLGLPTGLFPSCFPTKALYDPSPHPYAPRSQPISFFSILSPAQYWMRNTYIYIYIHTHIHIHIHIYIVYWPLKMGPIGCPETSVRNCHSLLRNIPKECRCFEESFVNCSGRQTRLQGVSLSARHCMRCTGEIVMNLYEKLKSQARPFD